MSHLRCLGEERRKGVGANDPGLTPLAHDGCRVAAGGGSREIEGVGLSISAKNGFCDAAVGIETDEEPFGIDGEGVTLRA